MNATTGLYLFILASVFIESLGSPGMINSTGNYENPSFRWAAGISNLDFFYSGARPYDWYFQDIKSAQVTGRSCGAVNSINRTHDVTVSCNTSDSTITPVFSILSKLQLENYSISVKIDEKSPAEGTITQAEGTITIVYCPRLMPNTSVKIMPEIMSSEAGFKDFVDYSCDTTSAASTLIIDGSNPVQSYRRTCQYYADWDGTENIQCYFAPSPELLIKPTTANYTAGVTIVLTCEGKDNGNPGYATEQFFLQLAGDSSQNGPGSKEEVEGESLTINYTMHNGNISCQGINEYVKIYNPQSGFSGQKTLIVLFEPVSLLEADAATQSSALLSAVSLKFRFAANPPVGNESLQLHFSSETSGTEAKGILPESLQIDQQYHVYNHKILAVERSDYGTYMLTVTSDLSFEVLNMTITLEEAPARTTAIGTTDRVTNIVTSSTASNGSTVGPPIGLIVGASIGGVVLIVLIVVAVIFIMKRRNAKPDNSAKEEKLNPIYGSSAGPSSNEQNGGREERDNPLYKSSDGGGLEIEEAYGAVNSKQGKKKGTENTAFSPEATEVTYAAVNKPKKNKKAEVPQEAVYSAVDKKKKKKDPDSELGLHGSPVH